MGPQSSSSGWKLLIFPVLALILCHHLSSTSSHVHTHPHTHMAILHVTDWVRCSQTGSHTWNSWNIYSEALVIFNVAHRNKLCVQSPSHTYDGGMWDVHIQLECTWKAALVLKSVNWCGPRWLSLSLHLLPLSLFSPPSILEDSG